MKQRADQLLVERGLAESRTRGQALILAGRVFTGERRVGKPGEALRTDAPLDVRGQDHPWVSRGGVKLAHALEHFALSASGRVCLDIGASTGGFTDVLLARGAARVHAVDVGRGQLAWKLRSDPRVVLHERVNARYLAPERIGESVAALVCDASFIGLATVLPAPLALCGPGAWAVALIKPQFEAGPAAVGAGGVVRDAARASRRVRADRRLVERPAGLDGARRDRQPDQRPRRQSRVPDRGQPGASVGRDRRRREVGVGQRHRRRRAPAPRRTRDSACRAPCRRDRRACRRR